MWELYALWVFTPVILNHYLDFHTAYDFNVSLWSFLIIGLGVIGCIVGGRIAHNRGASKVAFASLHLSLICCLMFPFVFYSSPMLFIPFMLFWGIVVIANSVTRELKGTALTVSTCIGFGVTIVSIQFVGILNSYFSNPIVFVIMALGPIVAIFYSRFLNR
jgi:predicted MFS family arabinose efflux permease